MADRGIGSRLGQLSQQIPVANQRLAAQQKAARDIQLQQMVRQAQPVQATPAIAEQAGTAVAQQAGQQQVQAVGAQAQAQDQIAALGQQVQAVENQARVGDLQAGLRDQQITDAERFAQVSEQAKAEMFDSRRKFAQNELGRKFDNERQLADYAKLRARSDEDWKSYTQSMDQLSRRKSQMLGAAQGRIEQQLVQQQTELEQLRDQISQRGIRENERAAKVATYEQKLGQYQRLRQAKVDLSRSLGKEQAKAGNRQMQYQAMGSVAGAVIGGVVGSVVPVVGTAAGAMAGSAIGGGLGSLASTIGG